MIQHQGEYGAVIAGKSVQNQRVERLNGDLNRHVNRPFSEIFHDLQLRGELKAKNDVDLFFLQFVYLPSWAIGEFVNLSYNCHSLLTRTLLHCNYYGQIRVQSSCTVVIPHVA